MLRSSNSIRYLCAIRREMYTILSLRSASKGAESSVKFHIHEEKLMIIKSNSDEQDRGCFNKQRRMIGFGRHGHDNCTLRL